MNQRPVMLRAGGIARGVPAFSAAATYLADCSEWQPDISDARYVAWSKAIGIRAMYGDAHDDGAWYGGARRRDLHAAGIGVMLIYQYLVAGQDAAAQAHALVDLLGPLEAGEMPVCDLEEGTSCASRWEQWRAVILDAYPQLRDTPSGSPWLYSGLDFATANGLRPQWVAAYQSTAPAMPHLLWQFSDAYPVPGVGIADCNVYNGSVADLRALITPEANPKPKPAPQEDGMLVSAELTPGQPVVVSWPHGQVSNLNIVSGAAASVQVRWRHENPALPGGWFTEPDPVVIGADGGLAVIVAATMDDVNAAELTLDADGGPAHVHST